MTGDEKGNEKGSELFFAERRRKRVTDAKKDAKKGQTRKRVRTILCQTEGALYPTETVPFFAVKERDPAGSPPPPRKVGQSPVNGYSLARSSTHEVSPYGRPVSLLRRMASSSAPGGS